MKQPVRMTGRKRRARWTAHRARFSFVPSLSAAAYRLKF